MDDDYEWAQKTFTYNPETGKLCWKSPPNKRLRIGQEVGTESRGHLWTKFRGKGTAVHQVIWLLMYGSWADSRIDHINEDGMDNSLGNLRKATNQENQHNVSHANSDSVTGVRGVSFDRSRNKYRATITLDKRHYHLGRFATIEAAAEAYASAKKQLHPFHVSKEKS